MNKEIDYNLDTIESHVKETIGGLKQRLAVEGRVDFIVHTWHPLNNSSYKGIRHAAIPLVSIPPFTLIPIISKTGAVHNSKFNPETNRMDSVPVSFTQDIESTMRDLIMDFGAVGLKSIDGLNLNLTNYSKAFTYMKWVKRPENFRNLEEACIYLGVPLPFQSDSNVRSRVELDIPTFQSTDSEDIDRLIILINTLKSCLEMTLTVAFHPTAGRISMDILAINRGKKVQFDPTTSWLLGEFPSYDATTKLTDNKGKNRNNPTTSANEDRLTSLLESMTGVLKELAQDKVNRDVIERKFNLEELNMKHADLPEKLRKVIREDASETELVSALTDYNNRRNNMELQVEDVLGLSAEELHQVDIITDDETVLKGGSDTREVVDNEDLTEGDPDPDSLGVDEEALAMMDGTESGHPDNVPESDDSDDATTNEDEPEEDESEEDESEEDESEEDESEEDEKEYATCAGVKADTTPCQRVVDAEGEYCHQHTDQAG